MKQLWQFLIPSLFALISTAPPIPAQTYSARPPAIQALVENVSDNRSTEKYGSCHVQLKFLGDASTDAVAISRVGAVRVIDDLNTELKLKPLGVYSDVYLKNLKREPGPLKCSLSFENPSRRASFIKTLEGEVELYTPTPENGGLIVIKDFFKNPPGPLQNPMLKRIGVEAAYFTREAFQSKKSEGTRGHSLFANGWGDTRTVAKIYVQDTNSILQNVDIQYSDGTSFAAQTTAYLKNNAKSINLTALPPAGSCLTITAFTPAAKRVYSFKLEKIPLP